METVYLLRSRHYATCTIGLMWAKGKRFYILEPPWKDNQNDISCIPPGEYICKFIEKSASGKYKDVYWLQDVEGRGGILIHNGNIVAHTLGCLIIGKRAGLLGGKRAVLSSKLALAEFVNLMKKEDFKLVIWEGR